jgi:hypothetical protein
MVFCRIIKGGECYIKRKYLKTHITIQVKVFHGLRKNFSFFVSILDKIQVIIDLLNSEDRTSMK